VTLARVLIIDCETTGLDPKVDRCIEVAATLFDVRSASPIASFASLVRADANASEAVNRIPVAVLVDAPEPARVWGSVAELAARADAIVAHRADFDRSFVPAEIGDARPWICSKFDLAWPRATRPGGSLVPLALEHGLGVAHAHRAMADVDTLSRLFARVAELGVDLAAFLARGLRPKAEFEALAARDQNELLKEHGFRWEKESERWLRTMAIEDAVALPFKVARADRPRGRFISLASYDEKETVKANGFRWDSARKEWWRVMAIEDVNALPFRCVREELEGGESR